MMNANLKNYADAHSGRPAIIYCCGPSLNDFDRTKLGLDNPVNIVMKMAMLAKDKFDKIDYYFFGDNNHKSKAYQGKIAKLGCPKFGLVYQNGLEVAETYSPEFCKKIGAEALNLSYWNGFKANIAKYPFYRCSTVFPCLQFALFLGCSPVYVVGMDLTQEESFRNPIENRGKIFMDKMSLHLERFRKFKKKNYPDVEVIRVNPVVGKSVFDRDLSL